MKTILAFTIMIGVLSCFSSPCCAQAARQETPQVSTAGPGMQDPGAGDRGMRMAGKDSNPYKEEDKYSGSEPSKYNEEGKMGTEERKEDNHTRIRPEFDKRRQ